MKIRYLGHFPQTRLRRLRQNNKLRHLVRENFLDIDRLILPLFIKSGSGIKNPIASMPGHYQLSVDLLAEEIKNITALGIKNIILFGIPEGKDSLGTEAYLPTGVIQRAIPIIKTIAPDLLIVSDVCLCEYTDHGHCGVVSVQSSHSSEKYINNDKTLALLAQQALSHAKAGVDIVAPSANMDGMVSAIREVLDQSSYQHIPILSYSVKYASSLYAPFRHAAEGTPTWGDRKTYQMDISNAHEATRECALDIAEGADILMVKPAHTYLDIISRIKRTYPELPLCAYHTSGEFAMIKAAAEKGWLEEHSTVLEILTAIYRAGANFIITYYAKEIAQWFA